jgi:hypothetical protein
MSTTNEPTRTLGGESEPPNRTTLSMMRVLSFVACLILGTSSVFGWKTCTVPQTNSTDDALAVKALLANCSEDATILFEAGKSYNIR